MTDVFPPGFGWAAPFLRELAMRGKVRDAATAVGVSVGTTYYLRQRNPAFAAAWEQALRPQDAPVGKTAATTLPAMRTDSGWRVRFLEGLAETSNVRASAALAGIPATTAYKLRRADAGFAARWRKALHEGYDNLEMELLGHLRDPQPGHKMDVASALRLLAAHRETVARERALAEDEDEQAVLDSIDRFIDDMRERRAANDRLLQQAGSTDHEHQ